MHDHKHDLFTKKVHVWCRVRAAQQAAWQRSASPGPLLAPWGGPRGAAAAGLGPAPTGEGPAQVQCYAGRTKPVTDCGCYLEYVMHM